jgi:hypothetical protein
VPLTDAGVCAVLTGAAVAWAALRGGARAAVFMFLVAVGMVLSVSFVFVGALVNFAGGVGLLFPVIGILIVWMTIRAWFRSEGYID